MTDPVISCVIQAPTGSLELNAGTYELERGALEEVAVTWRRSETSNPWVEGTFVTGAVRENVVRPLRVWVTGESQADLKAKTRALTDAFEQLTYTLSLVIDGVTTTWSCQPADYTVRSEQAFLFARQALVSASVPTKPTALVG